MCAFRGFQAVPERGAAVQEATRGDCRRWSRRFDVKTLSSLLREKQRSRRKEFRSEKERYVQVLRSINRKAQKVFELDLLGGDASSLGLWIGRR